MGLTARCLPVWFLLEALTGSPSLAFHSIQLLPVVLVLWAVPIFKTHRRGLWSHHHISCSLVCCLIVLCFPLLWTLMLTSRDNPGHSPHLKILHLVTPVGPPWLDKTLSRVLGIRMWSSWGRAATDHRLSTDGVCKGIEGWGVPSTFSSGAAP